MSRTFKNWSRLLTQECAALWSKVGAWIVHTYATVRIMMRNENEKINSFSE